MILARKKRYEILSSDKPSIILSSKNYFFEAKLKNDFRILSVTKEENKPTDRGLYLYFLDDDKTIINYDKTKYLIKGKKGEFLNYIAKKLRNTDSAEIIWEQKNSDDNIIELKFEGK